MPAGMNVGSIYAEAELDIAKFQQAAGAMAGEAGRIFSAMETAAAGMDQARAGLDGLERGLAGLASGEAAGAARAMADGVVSAATGGLSGADGIGRQFSAGLAAGIASGRSGVVSAARLVALAAAQAARAALDIHSPSKLTERFGAMFDMGFVRGVRREMPAIDDAVREAVYIGVPAFAARRDSGGGPFDAPAAAGIDYGAMAAALAEALDGRKQVLSLDGREVARINSGNTARAQNARARDIALRYGTK